MTQPSPIPTAEPGIHDLLFNELPPSPLRSLILQRRAIGIETYGVPLQASNGRDPLTDAAEEVADAIAYLRQKLERDGWEDDELVTIYGMAIALGDRLCRYEEGGRR